MFFSATILLGPGQGVAGLTLFPVSTRVAIIQAVTGIAVARNLFPTLIRVAKIAANLLMGPFQLELGFFMFEAVL